ncbi:MAG TPA: LicD family protein [Bacillota bacterium]|nr:LicD family protein [Bacillota bacterium]
MEYDEKIKEVQRVELEILEEVIRVCDENNIDYFIVFGTTLGAIRHGGFIPWDDDIDVGMTRDNYEKFLKIAPTKLKKDYFMQHFSTEPNMPLYFAKVRKNNTQFVEYYTRKAKIHQGIFIDIFPFDQVPNSEKLRRKQFRRAWMWRKMFFAKSVTDTHAKGLKGLLGKIRRSIRHFLLIPVPKRLLFNLVDEEVRKYNDEQQCSALAFILEPSAVAVPKEVLFPLRTVKFEHLTVKAPNNCDAYLKKCYGDYWQLPPEEKRGGHNAYYVQV